MVKIRPTTDQDRQEEKAAVRRMVTMAGGVSAFEKVTRVNASTLSRYGAPDEVDYHIPFDIALDLTLDTGNPALLILFADKCGFDVSPRNSCNKSNQLPDAADFSQLSSANSALFAEFIRANSDSNITPRERQQVLANYDALIQLVIEGRRKFEAGTAQGGEA